MLREWIHRLGGTFRIGRRDGDLEEELRLHVEMAAADAERRGLSASDARRLARVRVGGIAPSLDAMRDQRGWPWLDALKADTIFSLRYLNKHRTVSVAAVLSLGLTIGATTSAFRLVDAVLLRELPVRDPDRLFYVTAILADEQKRAEVHDYFDYPTFKRYSQALGSSGDLLLLGMAARQEVSVGSSSEVERVYRQYVSGNVFSNFGLQPALGRLIGPTDDVTPGAHQVAVVSHEYWTRRFGGDASVIGSSLRLGAQVYEIIGVAPRGFTGTEPGRMTDVFIPATMNVQALNSPGWSWFWMWARPRPGVSEHQIRDVLQAVFLEDHRLRLSSFATDTPKARLDAYMSEEIRLHPAGAGASNLQSTFRKPLLILAGLVALVLLIACTNVANLLSAQSMARARELALRVSIGAGRARLVQLVLVEAAILALAASLLGALLAWWAAPFVVSMLAPPDDPVRLVLAVDWRSLAFAAGLSAAVTVLFGLLPALRAAAVDPLGAIKGAKDLRTPRRLPHSLVTAQMAFCVFVLLAAWLFVASFQRLTNRPLGFATEDILVLETEVRGGSVPAGTWTEVTDHLRNAPGVRMVGYAGWALMSGNGWTAGVRPPGSREPRPANALTVSPGFLETMKIGLISGRDVRPGDTPPSIGQQSGPLRSGIGIVNEAFARAYFAGRSPVGQSIDVRGSKDAYVSMEIVGLVTDAAYRNVRDPIPPTIYVPFLARGNGAIVVRTVGDPLAIVPTLRAELSRARPEFIVRNAGTQASLVRSQLVRERLLAALSLFFAAVALLLAAIGLYGVLNYSVVQQRREIGIRMALGARATHIVKQIAAGKLASVLIGAALGVAGGVAFGRVVKALLFEITPSDASTLFVPILTLSVAAIVATLAPVIRALRIDPANTLRID
jgi:predicted permease